MDTKDQTIKLYKSIQKNAQMGQGTVTHLLGAHPGKELEESLRKQRAEYTAVNRKAASELRKMGEKPKGLSFFEKRRTDMMVSLSLMGRKDDRHMAQMLMNGGTMGLIDAQKRLSDAPDADEEARDLMQRLSDFEENTIKEMKPFL